MSNEKDIIKKAKELKESGVNVKVLRIGNDVYIVKPMSHTDYSEYLSLISQENAMEESTKFYNKFILEPKDIDLTKMISGRVEKLKEGIMKASGFLDEISIIYDSTASDILDKFEDDKIKKMKEENTNIKIALINNIPFVITPLTMDEYQKYLENVTNVQNLPADEQKNTIIKLDVELVKTHTIYPENVPDEAGYIDSLYRAIHTISGFTDEVNIVEVEDL